MERFSVVLLGDTAPNRKVAGRLTQYLLNLAVHILRLTVRRLKTPNPPFGNSNLTCLSTNNLFALDLGLGRRSAEQPRNPIGNEIIATNTQSHN